MREAKVNIVKYINMEEVVNMIEEIYVKNKDEIDNCDLVVGVGRAGAIVGALLASKIGKRFDYYGRIGEKRRYDCRILLVEDVIGSGKTIEKVLGSIEAKEVVVFSLLVSEGFVERGYSFRLICYAIESDRIWWLFEWDLKDFAEGNRMKYSREVVK